MNYSFKTLQKGLGRKFITFPRGLVFVESRTEDTNAQVFF